MIEYNCEGCGIKVVRQVGDEGRKRFCSVKCARAHQIMASREERYWGKVIKNPEGCWGWSGRRSTFGYGVIHTGPRGASRQEVAHRISWEIHNGPIPAGLHVCHHCDNPPCSNPDHLYVGDQAANMADRDERGRHGTAKLTPSDIRSIRARRAMGERLATLSHDFGVSIGQVSLIARRLAYKHVE